MSLYRINIITLFPNFFESPLKASLLGKAIQKNILNVNLINLRDYAVNQHGQVDDTPYGGGAGMVLMVKPIDQAILNIKKSQKSFSLLFTPRGRLFSQQIAEDLFKKMGAGFSLNLICGHYEGVDERVSDMVTEDSISIGHFVLSGGESAALVVLEAVARFIPKFMGNGESLKTESFSEEGYIEHPHYTRPATYKGLSVPKVLISGHHKKIREWRKEMNVGSLAE